MNNLLSVWLVPAENDKEYLYKTIKDLAKEYDSPVFIPHLTLFGDIDIDTEELKKAIDKVFNKIKPFRIRTTAISRSELFFKTVFIEFEKSELLINLFENLSKETYKKDIVTFKPHISLIYKTMPEEEKLKIIEKLNIKDDFLINRVVINAPKEGKKDFLDIEGWRALYEKNLND